MSGVEIKGKDGGIRVIEKSQRKPSPTHFRSPNRSCGLDCSIAYCARECELRQCVHVEAERLDARDNFGVSHNRN